jgi:glycosyltransferase involved in cell wall biosynthesis
VEQMAVTLVAAISPATTRPGGIRSYVLGLAKYLANAGHKVTLVGVGSSVPGTPYDFAQALSGSATTSVSFHRALRKLRRQGALPGGVIHCQRPDDLEALRPMDRHAAVVTIHGDPLPGVRQRHGRLVGAAYRRLERRGVEAADRILFLNSSDRIAFHHRYPDMISKFRDSDAGVDLSLFRPLDREVARARWKLGPGPHVLFAGRFEKEKNLVGLAKALVMSKSQPTLILAGSGNEAPRLRQAFVGLRYRFLGVVENQEMPELYSAVDATIIPSIREAMPLACLESLACGTPVVASSVGRLVEIIQPGRTGALADPAPESLARALDEVVERGGSMRPSCRATVQRYGWHQVGPKLVNAYQEIS